MYRSKGSLKNKIVSTSEFKAKCLRLIDEMQTDGIPITITKRGKVVAEVKPKIGSPRGPLFGSMKGSIIIHDDLDEPLDSDWETKWGEKWDRLGFPVRSDTK